MGSEITEVDLIPSPSPQGEGSATTHGQGLAAIGKFLQNTDKKYKIDFSISANSRILRSDNGVVVLGKMRKRVAMTDQAMHTRLINKTNDEICVF